MEFINLLLYSNIIIIYALPLDGNANSKFYMENAEYVADFHLYTILPLRYTIELELDTEKDIFHGICIIDINIFNITQDIFLRSMNLNISQVSLTKTIIDNIIRYNAPTISYIKEMQLVIFKFTSFLIPDIYTLNITFNGIISNDIGGFVKISYINEVGDKKWFFASDNSAIGMRRVFPCWDEPGIKTNFSIYIKHHKNYTALSNTLFVPKVHSTDIKDVVVTHFKISKIPSYRMAILLFDWNDYIFMNSMKIVQRLWCRKLTIQDQIFAFNYIANVTHTVEADWQLQEGYLLANHFTIAGLKNDGMDKLNFVFYREEDIIYSDIIDPIARKIEISHLIGRKVISKLFDIRVTPSWWSYMWLNEGISTLFGIYTINKIMPSFRSLDLFVVRTQQESLHLDDGQIMNPLTSQINSISEIDSLFSFVYYIKAPCILRMLQHVLKEEIFLEGIKVYMKKQWGNLDGFWDLMQSVLDKQQNTGDTRGYISLKDLMDPWVKKKQYPVLKSHTELNSNMKKLNVVMENMSGTFKIPVTYIRLPKPNFHNTLPKFWIYFKSVVRLTFVFPYVTWLLLNLQQTGYYRVNYQKNDLLEIGEYLHTKNYTSIHVLNRAQIIDDTFHFITTGEFDSPATFWYLVAYLHQELDYIAWYPMFKAMERMSFIIPFNESSHFKTKILGLLRPLLQKIGYEEFNTDEDLTKCLKQEAVKWACVLGDIECKKMAERKLEWHLSNKTSNYLLPWWRKWTYCNGLSISTTSFSKVFHNLNDIFETNNSKILEYLACTNKTSDIQLAVLGKNLSSENNPRKNIIVRNCISVFFDVILRHAKDKLLHVITSHWEKIKLKEINGIAILITIINNAYSEVQLTEAKRFAEDMTRKGHLTFHFNSDYFGSEIVFFNTEETKRFNKIIEENIKRQINLLLFTVVQQKIDRRRSEIQKHVNDYINKYV